MDTQHPPYLPSTQQPRQLVRWLDVNAQNGPLQRTQKFITIPAFNLNYYWQGYSETILAFDYISPNKFSLKTIPTPSNPSCMVCIAYSDSTGVHRYSLWTHKNAVVYGPITPYIGQQIKNKFRIEIWSVGVSLPVVPPGPQHSVIITIDNPLITIDNPAITLDQITL